MLKHKVTLVVVFISYSFFLSSLSWGDFVPPHPLGGEAPHIPPLNKGGWFPIKPPGGEPRSFKVMILISDSTQSPLRDWVVMTDSVDVLSSELRLVFLVRQLKESVQLIDSVDEELLSSQLVPSSLIDSMVV